MLRCTAWQQLELEQLPPVLRPPLGPDIQHFGAAPEGVCCRPSPCHRAASLAPIPVLIRSVLRERRPPLPDSPVHLATASSRRAPKRLEGPSPPAARCAALGGRARALPVL